MQIFWSVRAWKKPDTDTFLHGSIIRSLTIIFYATEIHSLIISFVVYSVKDGDFIVVFLIFNLNSLMQLKWHLTFN